MGTEFQSHSLSCVTNCVGAGLQSRLAHRLAPSKSLSALRALKTIEAAMRGLAAISCRVWRYEQKFCRTAIVLKSRAKRATGRSKNADGLTLLWGE